MFKDHPDYVSSRFGVQISFQQFIIAVLVVSIQVAILLVLSFIPIPKPNETAFNLFIGAMIGSVTTILAFYFPSSVGSRQKDETIAALSAKVSPHDMRTTTTVDTTTTSTPTPTIKETCDVAGCTNPGKDPPASNGNPGSDWPFPPTPNGSHPA